MFQVQELKRLYLSQKFRRVSWLLILISLVPIHESICPSLAKAEGLGTLCWARPVSLHRIHGHNVCFKVPETQYPGINSLAARPATVKKCQDANALDPGCEHGACCFDQCEKVTTCLRLTPNRTPVFESLSERVLTYGDIQE